MRCRLALLLVLFVAAFVATAHAEPLASDVSDDGFVMLFNGQDLTGWKTGGDWVVEDGGVLALKPKPGKRGFFSYRLYLWTKKKYSNFVLDLEFKLAPGGDSSIFVRSQSIARFTEVELSDSYGKQEPLTDKDCGGILKVAAPSKNMAKPAGQWNRMMITCQGDRMQVTLNDEQIADVDVAEALDKEVPRSGNIGLQDWGHPVWFRNIRIKEIR